MAVKNFRLAEEIAKTEGTPFYLFDEQEILQNLEEIRSAFSGWKGRGGARVLYSLKSNPLPGIVRVLASRGSGFEVTTIGEVELLRRLNVPMGQCVYTGLWKPRADIEQCLRHGLSTMTVDSVHDALAIESAAENVGTAVRVLIRVNPGSLRQRTVFASAGETSKVGAWILPRPFRAGEDQDDADSVVSRVLESRHLKLTGIHSYLGSQIEELRLFRDFARRLGRFYLRLRRRHRVEVDLIDIGGGFPARYTGSSVPTPASIAREVFAGLAPSGFRGTLLVEPGRYITASAGLLVTRVAKLKHSPPYGRIAILDASAYNVLLDTLVADWHYDLRILKGHRKMHTSRVLLAGCTNDSLDIFDRTDARGFRRPITGRPRRLPSLREGDLVIFQGAGAYTVSFNMNYALIPSPAVYLSRTTGLVETVRPPETVSDVVHRLGPLDAEPSRL
jgi:diaminopimelate decarboxylase